MSRDALLLKVLNLSALLAGAAAFAFTGHAGDYGLSDLAVKWIALIATLLGTASGWLSTSPLPGKSDDNTVAGTGKFIGMLLICALAGSTLISCAGNIHVNLIKAHQAIETGLATVDDAERVVCFGTKDLKQVPDPTHCTTALAVTAKLTDAKHQEFHRLLSKAYDAQARLGPVLQSWTGPGLPADLTEVLALADQVTKLARDFNPSVPDVGAIITDVLKWQSELASLKTALSGGVK